MRPFAGLSQQYSLLLKSVAKYVVFEADRTQTEFLPPVGNGMYILYARPGAGSAAVEAVLTECGATFQLADVPRSGRDYEDYLGINPRGEIPSLQLPDHSIMTESAAMLIYLGDIFSDVGLAPALDSVLRARYLRWMIYFASAVYAADLRFHHAARYSTDVSAADGIRAKAAIDLERDLSIFASALGKKPYVLGDLFSAVDIYAAMLVSWAPDVKGLFANHPEIKRHYDLVTARPTIAKVWERNNLFLTLGTSA